MSFSPHELKIIETHIDKLLTQLNVLTVDYASKNKMEHLHVVMQGALVMYMTNIIGATIFAMETTKEEKTEFLEKFKTVIIEALSRINIDKICEQEISHETSTR